MTKSQGWKGKVVLVEKNDLIVWDTITQSTLAIFSHPKLPFYAIQLRNGSLVCGSDDHNIYIWDINSRKCKILSGHHETVYTILELQNGNLISECDAGNIKVWDLNTCRCLQTIQNTGIMTAFLQLRDGTVITTDLEFVFILDLSTGQKTNTIRTSLNAHYQLVELENGQILIVGENGIVLVNIFTEKIITRFEYDNQDSIYSCAVLYNGHIAAANTKKLMIWNEKGEYLQSISLQFCPMLATIYVLYGRSRTWCNWVHKWRKYINLEH
jgi:WD40 repeat protein